MAPRLLRWPEMRYSDSEGVGSRGKHQDAWLIAVNMQVVSALAGVHPNSGAVRLLLPRAPAGSDAHGADESEHKEVAQGA